MENELVQFVKTIRKQIQLYRTVISEGIKKIKKFIAENPDFFDSIRSIVEELENWPEKQKAIFAEVARLGWFINWEIPLTINTIILEGKESIDKHMIEHFHFHWESLTNKILELCPERAVILKTAFDLHSKQNYIASIPLLLAQTDGICAEYLGAFLFSEHEKRNLSIEELITNSSEEVLSILFEPLKVKTQFGAGISKSSKSKKEQAPNRNGILHGSKNHLDYGTEINSLKCFSLLAFVVHILIDEDYNKKTA